MPQLVAKKVALKKAAVKAKMAAPKKAATKSPFSFLATATVTVALGGRGRC